MPVGDERVEGERTVGQRVAGQLSEDASADERFRLVAAGGVGIQHRPGRCVAQVVIHLVGHTDARILVAKRGRILHGTWKRLSLERLLVAYPSIHVYPRRDDGRLEPARLAEPHVRTNRTAGDYQRM